MMKRTFSNVKTVVTLALCFMIISSFVGRAINTVSGANDNKLQSTDTDVQMITKNSGTTDSSYQVGATLPGTAFSSISQVLEDKIAQEWKTYDGMTKEGKFYQVIFGGSFI